MSNATALPHPSIDRLAAFFGSLVATAFINDRNPESPTRTAELVRHGISCHPDLPDISIRLVGGSGLLTQSGASRNHEDVVFTFFLPTNGVILNSSDPRLFVFKAEAEIPDDPERAIKMKLDPQIFFASDPDAALRAKVPGLFLEAWLKFSQDS